MTKLVFENAAFAEMVRRLDRIVPKKGEAFDKAGGVFFDINPGVEWGVVARATDLQVFYMEWSTPLKGEGAPTRWRVMGPVLSNVVNSLPIGSDRTVTLEDKDGKLHITSGKLRARISLMDTQYYPDWQPFNPEGTVAVPMLGARIEQVAWAAAREGDLLTGVHFDGQRLVATDRYKLAAVPVEAPHIYRPVTVPAAALGPILRQMGDTAIGIVDSQLVLMPNPYTQIRCTIYEGKYPPVERVMRRDSPQKVTFNKTHFLDALNRVQAFSKADRLPAVRLTIGEGAVEMYMRGDSTEEDIEDAIELPEVAHPAHAIKITPKNLADALQAAPNESVTLHYDLSNSAKMLYITSGSFEAWLVPHVDIGGES